MKTLYSVLIGFFMVIAMSSNSGADDYEVYGADNASVVNGLYIEDGTLTTTMHNGIGPQPLFRNGAYRMGYRGCILQWVIITGASDDIVNCGRGTGYIYGSDSQGVYDSSSGYWYPPEGLWEGCHYNAGVSPQPYPTVATAAPPTPNPLTWASAPSATTSSSITMVATTANDVSLPISYYFDFYNSPTGGPGGNDSGWQSSTSYTDTGLGVNHRYGYRVRARDNVDLRTSYSSPVYYRYTRANVPGASSFSNVTQNTIRVNWTANGNRSGTEYYCENTTAGSNSVWTTDTNWNSVGLSCGTSYSFRVRARNGDGVTTGWLYLGSQATQACPTPGDLSVTPSGGLISSGYEGGPFSPSSETYTLENTGGTSIVWSASNGETWVSLSSTGGTLAASGSTTVTVSINSNAVDLPGGTYSDTVSFINETNGSGNQTRSVSLTVIELPFILINPSSLSPSCTEGNNASSQSFEVSNDGGGELSYSISDDADWLNCTPTGGTSTGEYHTITVNYSTSTLSIGTHTAEITISDSGASNSPQTIAVTLTVSEQPENPGSGGDDSSGSSGSGSGGAVAGCFITTAAYGFLVEP